MIEMFEPATPPAASPVSQEVVAGWKLVPVKATAEMLACCAQDEGSKISDTAAFADSLWSEMVAAAPKPANGVSDAERYQQ